MPTDKVARVIALLDEWADDESGYDEATWSRLKEAIEESRLSTRRRFRDEVAMPDPPKPPWDKRSGLDHMLYDPHASCSWGKELLAAARAELESLRSLAGIGAAHCVDVGPYAGPVKYVGPTVTCTFTCPKCGETTTEGEDDGN